MDSPKLTSPAAHKGGASALRRAGGADMLSPRNFTAVGLPGVGMPQERLARIAARRTFVELKAHFMDAVSDLDGEQGRWLQHQVRQTSQPVDLWLLRSAVFSALRERPQGDRCCGELHRCLDSVFPNAGMYSGYASF
jgi:hypothetical protein